MKKFLLVIALFFVAPHAFAASSQVLFGGSVSTISATNMVVNTCGQYSGLASADSISFGQIAASGVMGTLYVKIATAPGAGSARTFSIRKNLATTTLACTISGTDTTCTDLNLSHAVTWSAGDTCTVSYLPDPSVAPTANVGTSVSTVYTPTVPGNLILQAFDTTTSASAEVFGYVSGSAALSATESDVMQIIPEAGTIDSLYLRLNAAANGGGYTFTGRLNSASTTLTCATTASACTDIVNTVAVSVGDRFNWAVDPTNPASAPTVRNPGFGMRFRPTTKMITSIFLSTPSSGTDSATVNRFLGASGITPPSAEAAVKSVIPQDFVLRTFMVITTAPGGVASRTFSIRKNGVSMDGCTITGAATTCTWTGDIRFVPGDTFDFLDAPTGSPATGVPFISSSGYSSSGLFQVLKKLILTGKLTIL